MNILKKITMLWIFLISVQANYLDASLQKLVTKLVLDTNYTEKDYYTICNTIPCLQNFISLQPTGAKLNNKPLFDLTIYSDNEETVQAIITSNDAIFDKFDSNLETVIKNKEDLDTTQDPIIKFVKNVICLQPLLHTHFQSDSYFVHLAIENEHIQALKFLIDANANLDEKNGKITPLHRACKHEKGFEMFSLILDAGADKNTIYFGNKTLLHVATEQKDCRTVQKCLDAGFDVNLLDGYNRTPLHCAAYHGYPEVVALLIANSADLNIQDKEGRTPLKSARRSYNTHRDEIISLLIAAGAKDDSSCIIS